MLFCLVMYNLIIMEQNRDITQNVMPEIVLFPLIEKVVSFVGGLIRHLDFTSYDSSKNYIPFEEPHTWKNQQD